MGWKILFIKNSKRNSMDFFIQKENQTWDKINFALTIQELLSSKLKYSFGFIGFSWFNKTLSFGFILGFVLWFYSPTNLLFSWYLFVAAYSTLSREKILLLLNDLLIFLLRQIMGVILRSNWASLDFFWIGMTDFEKWWWWSYLRRKRDDLTQ